MIGTFGEMVKWYQRFSKQTWWGNPTVWNAPHGPNILDAGFRKRTIHFATERLEGLDAHGSSWLVAEALVQAR